MECSCEVETCDGTKADVYRAERVKVRKAHQCIECAEVIPRGATAEVVNALWDGHWDRFYTCELCLRIRDDLMGSHFCHGTMREDLFYCTGVDYITGEIADEGSI
jgi:hypothetical protein